MPAKVLRPEELTVICDPKKFGRGTTSLTPLTGFIGQEIAEEALVFGLTQKADGYNILISNPIGSGKQSALRRFIEEVIARHIGKRELHDYCYVHNFEDPSKPKLIVLRAGAGKRFRQAMLDFLNDVTDPAHYEKIKQSLWERSQKMIMEINETQDLKDNRLELSIDQRGPSFSIILAVLDHSGKPAPLETWLEEPQDPKERKKRENLRTMVLMRVAISQQSMIQDINTALDAALAEVTTSHILTLVEKFPETSGFVGQFAEYLNENREEIFSGKEHTPVISVGGIKFASQEASGPDEFALPFEVNVYVEHDPDAKAPPFVEPTEATFKNLFGEVTRRMVLGGVTTPDHTDFLAGDIARANEGFILLDAREIFTSPDGQFVWETLQRLLKHKKLAIEGIREHLGIIPGEIYPDPLPMNIKIILVADTDIYHVLTEHLEDTVSAFFRARVEFEHRTERTSENEKKYGAFVALCREKEGLLHFSADGIAALVEHGSRMAEDKYKLSLDMREIKGITIEAGRLAQESEVKRVTRKHVVYAITAKEKRVAQLRRLVQNSIAEGSRIVNVEGSAVGRANGLSVIGNGIPFGVPMSLTANIAHGSGSILSIDRSANLSGNIFDRGVDTVASFITGRYGGKTSLPYKISLAIEQNYSGVEGDSASALEVFLCLSALGNFPLRQDIAVTGSVNQHGEIQPIGGVNEKIEGFFDVCQMLGTLKGQGVLVPERNIRHLVLRPDVVAACRNGTFQIYTMSNITDGIELLAGQPMSLVDTAIKRRIRKAIKDRETEENKKDKKKAEETKK